MKTLRLEKDKTPSQINLVGVSIEAEMEDKSIVAINLTDAEGNTLCIKSNDTYSKNLSLFIPAPPQEKGVHTVSGTLHGTDYSAEFEDKITAEQHMRELNNTVNTALEVGESTIEVLEDDEDILPF